MALSAVSSEQALAAFKRLGCYTLRPASGSHLVICRDTPHGRISRPLVIGERELKRYTLRAIIRGLGFDEEEFAAAL